MLRRIPQILKVLPTQNIHISKFTFRQISDYKNGETLSSKTKDLLENAIITDDDLPDMVGPNGKKKKSRHPKKEEESEKSGVDLSDKSVILFPGQGSQFVGMGSKLLDIPSVKELYDQASQILNYDLLKICLEGPKTVLDQTHYCQAATVVTSLAAVELLFRKSPELVRNCLSVAGFSVGEITALIFSGAISFGEGIHLVKVRGEAMQAASEIEDGGMMTCFFGSDNDLAFACQVSREFIRREHDIEKPVCQVANHLYCGAKVLAGHKLALKFIEENKSDFKIRRVAMLPVSGAFHTPLMVPALDPFEVALSNTKVHNPRVPIYSNYDNRILTTSYQIKKYLPRQLVSPVRWESSMASLFISKPNDLLPNVLECGPGRSLSAILGKINGRAAKNCKYVQC